MPHGDFSDYAAWSCAGLGVTALFAPSLYFKTFGPVAAFFEGPITPELTCALRCWVCFFICNCICIGDTPEPPFSFDGRNSLAELGSQ